jgi:beta-1,4-mannosyltransferase
VYQWQNRAIVLYDKPPAQFQQVNFGAKHEIIFKLKDSYGMLKDCECDANTVISERDDLSGHLLEKKSRPALLISSTSWTEDENFELLLDALDLYEEKCSKSKHLPDVICFITGKGPQKEFYSNQIQNKIWRHVTVILPWLEAEDYPRLLAACDLGICLHTSSSKLDLPMKIVDMFGCALPVCAINYFW